MARRRKGRAVHGILLLNKPTGLSSNQALQRVKRLYGAAKAGHTGNLDPLATGMLPICLGEATKLSAQLLDADKTYIVRMRLGQGTDTADSDGKLVVESDCSHVDRAALEAVLPKFIGEIEQVPPMYSAIRHEGQRLYELARKGQDVERKVRHVTIYAITLRAFDHPVAELEVHCSKGTYIRTLVEDIAAALGTHAHVVMLHRTQVGPFAQDMVTDVELLALAEADDAHAQLDALLQPPESALVGWPQVKLSKDGVFYFRRGQAQQVRGAPASGRLAVYGPDDDLLGLAEIDDDGRVAPRRVLELNAENH